MQHDRGVNMRRCNKAGACVQQNGGNKCSSTTEHAWRAEERQTQSVPNTLPAFSSPCRRIFASETVVANLGWMEPQGFGESVSGVGRRSGHTPDSYPCSCYVHPVAAAGLTEGAAEVTLICSKYSLLLSPDGN